MHSIVVIPTAHRPEMLAKCLQYLDTARNRPNVHIYADNVDESRLSEIEQVRDLYLPDAFLFHAKSRPDVLSGSWNILNAIKDGARWAENVYLVEEDVLVYPEFFEWHEAQTTDASCGRFDRYTRNRVNLYTNPGSCLRRRLLDALLPHINDEYFTDQQKYCEKYLGSEYGYLDDGLIRRIIDKHNFTVSLAIPAVCAHIGFRLYNRASPYLNPGKTLEEKIKGLDGVLEIMNALPGNHPYRFLYETPRRLNE
jgi:hypothetical protein